MEALRQIESQISAEGADLAKIVFCRTMIACANVSFGHQSMSFKKNGTQRELFAEDDAVLSGWRKASAEIQQAAQSETVVEPRISVCDARELTRSLPRNYYSCVITSPPYPNRMSYIRELRPYMYWLGYLEDGRQAGELDWQAIGGTWGCATSNVAKWEPEESRKVPYKGFQKKLKAISETSPLLSNYVHKYFYDMVQHLQELQKIMAPNAIAHYIVGNSKFYDVLLPVEEIFASIFQAVGLEDVSIKTLRKRTSKKELFEYVVSGRKRS